MDDIKEWDRAAATFDEQPDHGLRDPVVLRAWTEFLRTCLPERRAAILDVGCGTGSLNIVLGGLGHDVAGIDPSPAMISRARAKAATAGHKIEFQVMDAAHPRLAPAQFDAIVCRHVLWTLPDTAQVLARWAGLLRAMGCLVIIEGRWGTGAGLAARQIIDSLPPAVTHVSMRALSFQAESWGGAAAYERHAIIAH